MPESPKIQMKLVTSIKRMLQDKLPAHIATVMSAICQLA